MYGQSCNSPSALSLLEGDRSVVFGCYTLPKWCEIFCYQNQDTCDVQKLHPSSIFHPSIYLSIYSISADLRTLVIAMPEGRFAQALPIPQLPAMKSSDVLHTNFLVVNHRSSCEDEECEPIGIRSFVNQRVYLGIFLWAQ